MILYVEESCVRSPKSSCTPRSTMSSTSSFFARRFPRIWTHALVDSIRTIQKRKYTFLSFPSLHAVGRFDNFSMPQGCFRTHEPAGVHS